MALVEERRQEEDCGMCIAHRSKGGKAKEGSADVCLTFRPPIPAGCFRRLDINVPDAGWKIKGAGND